MLRPFAYCLRASGCYLIRITMERRDEPSGFEIWRAVINLGGLAIMAGLVVLIVATILTG